MLERKTNNKHTSHPDSPPSRKLRRQKEAKIRQAAYDKLSIQEKLNRLPANGANRQRAKLNKKR